MSSSAQGALLARVNVCQLMLPVGLEVNAKAMKSTLLPLKVKRNVWKNAKSLSDANGSLFTSTNLLNLLASCSVIVPALIKLVRRA